MAAELGRAWRGEAGAAAAAAEARLRVPPLQRLEYRHVQQ